MKYTKQEKSQAGIYAIVNRLNGKFYIGSAKNFKVRWDRHKRELLNNEHHSPHLQAAYNKYGEINFEYRILDVVTPEEWEEEDDKFLTDLEQRYFDIFHPWDRNIGYNVCPVAGSTNGMEHTEAVKKKISEAGKGRTISEEHKRAISEANKGRVFSEETKKALSESKKGKPSKLKGKPRSEETKKNMSKSRSKTFCVLTSPEGEEFILKGYKAFCKERGLDQGATGKVLKGKANHHKKWTGYLIDEMTYYRLIGIKKKAA